MNRDERPLLLAFDEATIAPDERARSASDARRDERLIVRIEEVRFVSRDGSFAVVLAAREPALDEVILIGDLASARVGERARVVGRFERHPTHGERFRVESLVPILPSSRDGLAKFLGGGLAPGVGMKLASDLVARFGERTLDVISRESGRLREVRGLGGKRGQALAEAVRARLAEAESLALLQGLGLGRALSRKLYARFGPRTAAQIREDPYRLAEEIVGVGFLTADRIGREVGIAADDPRRARAAILFALARGADDGHSFLPRAELARAVERLEVPSALVPAALIGLSLDARIVIEDEAVFLASLHAAEVSLAGGLAARASAPIATAEDEPRGIAAIAEGLAARQREALLCSMRERVLVLTGGPGTGKTTTLRAIVAAHERLDHRVVLAAPTGRAAKRMSEATSREARTLHRLLEWSPGTGTFGRDAANPLEADLVIVDEASMLDLRLGAALEAALPEGASLVLVGDVDQLPPIGAGHVLREVIASERVAVVRLDRVFRQAEESAIVRGAHAIAHGHAPAPSTRGAERAGELFVVEAHEPERVLARLRDVLARIPRSYGLDPLRDVQVLTPMRRGPLGTDALNATLQAALVPAPPSHRGHLRPGDKVMQIVNDYEREVWNGDVGWVRRVVDGVTYVDFDVGERSYREDELEGLSLAYAVTVHKSQGSELPAIVLVLHTSHRVMLSRPLLYTAITRARRLVVIVGEPAAIELAARTSGRAEVHGRLAARLRASE